MNSNLRSTMRLFCEGLLPCSATSILYKRLSWSAIHSAWRSINAVALLHAVFCPLKECIADFLFPNDCRRKGPLMQSIVLRVNHVQHILQVEPNWTLLYVLRELLRLTGSKFGCGTGDCGACKVLIDGEAKNACTLLARNMEGKEIVTIEGIGSGGTLHPVQQAFISAGAIQCGFCTPGMVMSSIALLSRNPNPSDADILEALKNNLCRCTGYAKILDAIRLAAGQMAEECVAP